MKNKRLLAWLVLFIFLGGIAVTGALVFRVQEITISFAHEQTVLIENQQTALDGFRQEVANVAMGRNILIGLNREQIRSAIEGHDSRVRVVKEEARFPNVLYVRVQERFPMYYIRYEGHVAILCFELQIISDNELLLGMHDLNLVQLRPDQFASFDSELFQLASHTRTSIGMNLREFAKDDYTRADTLVYLGRLFFGQDYTEDNLGHIIDRIDFDVLDNGVQSDGTMLIVLTQDVRGSQNIRIEIKDYATRFNEKLANAWWVLENQHYYHHGAGYTTNLFPGVLVVDVNDVQHSARYGFVRVIFMPDPDGQGAP